MLYIAGISTIKVDKKSIKLKKETASACRWYAEPVILPYSLF